MQKIYNTINQNRLRIKESLSKQIDKSHRVVFFDSTLQDLGMELEAINQEIVSVLQDKVAPALNRNYGDDEERQNTLTTAFWLFGKKIDSLIALYEKVSAMHVEEFSQEQEVLNAVVELCSVMLKELMLLHVNIKDALQNNPENASLQYAPDIQSQLRIIQNYQQSTISSFSNNSSDWIFPLALCFLVGSM